MSTRRSRSQRKTKRAVEDEVGGADSAAEARPAAAKRARRTRKPATGADKGADAATGAKGATGPTPARRKRGSRGKAVTSAGGAGVGAGAGSGAGAPPVSSSAARRSAHGSGAGAGAGAGAGTAAATRAVSAGPRSMDLMAGVVKVYASCAPPNFAMPWQMKGQRESTASGFVISGRRILTNAHAVDHFTAVQVRRHGRPTKYRATVVAIGHDSDTALLAVDDEDFWADLPELELGGVPELQSKVTVIGYPTGGDSLSVTAGVVSRVDLHTYSQSSTSLLAVQIDAAINSGNSGGPAFHNGKVVGIAFEALEDAENIGYIISVPVVKHFLEDVEASRLPRIGFGRFGFSWQAVENEHLRASLKLKKGQTGIQVTKIQPVGPAASVLKARDVILSIDDQPIAHDGTIFFRHHERISFRYIGTQKHFGDKVQMSILRGGSPMRVSLTVGDLPPLVPQTLYNKPPSYFVHAGLVFTVLSEPYLQAEWKSHWQLKAPVKFVNAALNGVKKRVDQQLVVLAMVLSHPVNIGYDPVKFRYTTVTKVDGVRVRNLAHLTHLIDHPSTRSRYLVVLLANKKRIVLERRQAKVATAEVLELNNIVADRSKDLRHLPRHFELAGEDSDSDSD